jgi:hypothetical protein
MKYRSLTSKLSHNCSFLLGVNPIRQSCSPPRSLLHSTEVQDMTRVIDISLVRARVSKRQERRYIFAVQPLGPHGSTTPIPSINQSMLQKRDGSIFNISYKFRLQPSCRRLRKQEMHRNQLCQPKNLSFPRYRFLRVRFALSPRHSRALARSFMCTSSNNTRHYRLSRGWYLLFCRSIQTKRRGTASEY